MHTTNTFMPLCYNGFSEHFRDMDEKSFFNLRNARLVNKEYKKIMDKWSKPLERKKLKRERKLLNPILPRESEHEKIYVHS